MGRIHFHRRNRGPQRQTVLAGISKMSGSYNGWKRAFQPEWREGKLREGKQPGMFEGPGVGKVAVAQYVRVRQKQTSG